VCYDGIASRHLEVWLCQKTPILATKLFVPPLRSDLVLRQRLIDQLNAGGRQKLILVSAPAGYGKTTLVSSWISQNRTVSAWLSLDEDDNDPIRFFQYVLTALQRMIPAISGDLAGGTIPLETTLNLLINEIARQSGPFVLVLDDFHNISSPPVLDLSTTLLECTPPQIQFILLSRSDPPLPLARLRARNQLIEIRAAQLRFTQEEIRAFLNGIMLLDLSADDLAAMETRTEGWIAGLQLAALSLQGSKDSHGFVAAFAGSHHYIMDYLVAEVLAAQSEQVRSFLLQTSILDRMSASLCNSVVDTVDRQGTDSQDLLEALEQKNLFLFPLDEERHWYRYHHLFADVLNRRLEHQFPQSPSELHLRASKWDEQHGLIPEAIRHSLAAGGKKHAIELIEQNGCLLLIRGEVGTLQKWIETIEPFAQSRPWIDIFKAWIFALTGFPEQVEELFQTAEKSISSLKPAAEAGTMQGAIATGRAYLANLQGDTSQAMLSARQALEYLTDTDLVSRSLRTVAISLLGDASSINGDLEPARQAYLEAKQIGLAAGDKHLVIVTNSNLANILYEQGLLHQAAGIYRETLEMTARPDGQRSVLAGRASLELSQVFYEWNDLDAAYQLARQSLALCQQWGNVDLQAVGLVMLARLEHVWRHLETALESMHAAERLLSEHHFLPQYSIWVKCTLARLWIDLGNLEKASDLLQSAILVPDQEISHLDEPKYIALLHLLLAQGDDQNALALSQRLLQQVETAKRTGRVIEILILQALILQSRKNTDQALLLLERALILARPEGYVRTFLEEGRQMILLLHLARSRGIQKEYISALLSETEDAAEMAEVRSAELTEPLSRREMEVLKLIETGCSNQEISGRLFISIATVKRHISNIYAKLGVQNRTQAVSAGKELGLLK
jgi:LuxR family transcriptional regulator, maltose regulon positive regulatory protein